MKKISLLYGILLLGVLLTIHSFTLTAQTVTKTTTSPVTGAVCPNVITEYSVNIPNGFQNCSRLWTAANGQIDGSATGTTVKVKWNDTPGAKGRITCTFTNCGNSNDNQAPFHEELILSVKNQSWGPYGSSINVDYCSKAQVNLIAKQKIGHDADRGLL